MTSEIDWLRKLKSTPCDEFTFRALQDWLEERGDSRAENFRLSKWNERTKTNYNVDFYWPKVARKELGVSEDCRKLHKSCISDFLVHFLLQEYPQ